MANAKYDQAGEQSGQPIEAPAYGKVKQTGNKRHQGENRESASLCKTNLTGCYAPQTASAAPAD